MKENNIRSLNRSIYKYICMKKLINIFIQNNNFIKRLFVVYFEFIEAKYWIIIEKKYIIKINWKNYTTNIFIKTLILIININ